MTNVPRQVPLHLAPTRVHSMREAHANKALRHSWCKWLKWLKWLEWVKDVKAHTVTLSVTNPGFSRHRSYDLRQETPATDLRSRCWSRLMAPVRQKRTDNQFVPSAWRKKNSCKATLPIYRMFRFEYFELWFSFIRGLSFHFIIIKAGRSHPLHVQQTFAPLQSHYLFFPICFSHFLVGSCPCVLVSSYHPRISASASSVASDRLLPQQQAKPTSIFRDERKMQNIMCICCICVYIIIQVVQFS